MSKDSPWNRIMVDEEIGSGSYGTVYRVYLDGHPYAMKQIRIPRDAAVEKDLRRKLGSAEAVREYCRKMAEELLNEVEILRRFQDDPHIVAILDDRVTETENGCEIDLLMECLQALPEYETEHRMREEDCIRLGIEICCALETCKKEGILHRDLKPDNILVSEDGQFKVCDFSEARRMEKTFLSASVKGTFSYMAPEVYHGKKYDQRADLYSLSMILYRLLNNGKEPFLPAQQRIISPMEKERALNRRMNGEACPAPADASEGMTEILLKACAYYPEKRYADAAAMKEDLIRLQKGQYRVKKRTAGRFGKRTASFYIRAAVGALLLLGAFALSAYAVRSYVMEHVVNYCDTRMQDILRNEHGLSPTARLNGNGVLYIDSMDDLFALASNGLYPWTLQKDRIRTIVFGEAVEGYMGPLEEGDFSLFYPHGHEDTVVVLSDELYPLTVSPTIFHNCRNLKEIEVRGKRFTFNYFFSFAGCTGLEVIRYPEDAEILVDKSRTVLSDTAWYKKAGWRVLGTTLVRYNGEDPEPEGMPDGIEAIAAEAFSGNETIERIRLPEQVREIGRRAFSGCLRLKEINLPEGLEKIGDGGFKDCISLESVHLPKTLTSLGNFVFRGCADLTNFTVQPGNLAFRVEDGALYHLGMKALLWCTPGVRGELSVPEWVESIDMLAFEDASLLESLIIPAGASHVSTSLFGKSPLLKNVVVSEGNTGMVVEDGILYSANRNQLILCMRNRTGSIQFDGRVVTIMEHAFDSCKDISEITVPNSVGYIMGYAFADCVGLRSVRLPRSLRFIAPQAFAGCDALTDLYYAGTEEEWIQKTASYDLGLDSDRITFHFGGEEPE